MLTPNWDSLALALAILMLAAVFVSFFWMLPPSRECGPFVSVAYRPLWLRVLLWPVRNRGAGYFYVNREDL